MNPKVIGIVGFKNSGKDTSAGYMIQDFGYTKDSFAAPLKDACAAIFGWDRDMLEGETLESREWREIVDPYWSHKLGIDDFSPRKALQLVGTEKLREGLHEDIWILSLSRRVVKISDNVVITDCRFPNEIEAIRKLNGSVIRIKRGPEPYWYKLAEEAMVKNLIGPLRELKRIGIHASEYSWVGSDIDYIIENDGSLEDLRKKVNKLFERFNDRSVSL